MMYRTEDRPDREGTGGEVRVRRRRWGLWWTRWRMRYGVVHVGIYGDEVVAPRLEVLKEAQAAKRNMQTSGRWLLMFAPRPAGAYASTNTGGTMNEAQAIATTPWPLIAAIVVISAAVSWGITEAIKKTAKKKFRVDHDATDSEASRQLWWTPMLVVVSILIGAGVGAAIGGYEWSALYGSALGAGGGAMATFIVALIKGNLADLAKRFTK